MLMFQLPLKWFISIITVPHFEQHTQTCSLLEDTFFVPCERIKSVKVFLSHSTSYFLCSVSWVSVEVNQVYESQKDRRSVAVAQESQWNLQKYIQGQSAMLFLSLILSVFFVLNVFMRQYTVLYVCFYACVSATCDCAGVRIFKSARIVCVCVCMAACVPFLFLFFLFLRPLEILS